MNHESMDLDELVATLRAIEPDPAVLATVRSSLPAGTHGGGAGGGASGGFGSSSFASKLFIAFVATGVMLPATDPAFVPDAAAVAKIPAVARVEPAPVESAIAVEAPAPAIEPAPVRIEALPARRARRHARRASPDDGAFGTAGKPIDEAARAAQSMPVETPPDDVSTPPSESYANALRHYSRQEHERAASLAFEVASGASSDTPSRAAHAELVLAKALFHLGFYHSSAIAFDAITERGREHPYFAECLPWIAKLASFVPEDAAVVSSISRYTPAELADLDRPESRDEYENVVYLMGRTRYDAGEIDPAVALFASLPRTSRLWLKAQIKLGVAHVRARRARPAVAAFRGAAEAIDDSDVSVDEEDRLRNLSWLNLARVYYTAANQSEEAGRPVMDGALVGAAVDAWDHIPESSEYWPVALLEQAWALFLAGADDRALGKIHALLSPFFEGRHVPEAHVIRAVVLFQHCNFDSTRAALVEFHRRYDTLLGELRSVRSSTADPERAYALLARVRGGRAGLPFRSERVVSEALRDRSLLRRVDAIDGVHGESTRLASAGFAPDLEAQLLQNLAIAESFAIDSTGDLVIARIARLVEELEDRMNEMDAVEVELLTAEREGRREVDTAPPTVEADQEHVVWPFDGEFWEDELPYFRVRVADRCGR
jgi:hypothetical protein